MRVPRYTSYPTAPNFSPAIGEGDYRSWLRSIPENEPTSIYLHVPFCREMCWYCGCTTTVTRREAPIARYAATLAKEIELAGAQLQSKPRVGHLHWGGGSPTLLAPDAIAGLTAQLRALFAFDGNAEIAVEVDPRALGREVVEAFAQAGVNRASVGVQSFDPAVQLAINRLQSFETTARAVELLRGNGVAGINFDLIYGLPHQTVASCTSTVEQALRLRPDRLAVFGYAHVPSFKPHQRKIDERDLPGEAARARQFQCIAELLVREAYVHVGLDHFALPDDPLAKAAGAGRLHRNFQGYTTDLCTTLLGFGASAIGQLRQGFAQNASRIPEYERQIGQGELAVVRGVRLTDEDRRRAAVIEQLMCDFEADVAGLAVPLQQLENDGLIRRCGSRIHVADDARPLVRTIAAAFDAYLPSSTAKHAIAV